LRLAGLLAVSVREHRKQREAIMEESLSSIQPLGGEPKELSSRLPEEYLPTDDELIALVRQRVRLSLREISNRLWPMLPWRPLTPSGDSVTQDLRWRGR
jgi:hypothetical protein